ALVRSDLCCDIAKNRFTVGEGDLFASNGRASCRWIRSSHLPFGPNAEARDRLAGGGVCVELSLQIFQVEREVQNVLLVDFFRHGSPPISGWSSPGFRSGGLPPFTKLPFARSEEHTSELQS